MPENTDSLLRPLVSEVTKSICLILDGDARIDDIGMFNSRQ